MLKSNISSVARLDHENLGRLYERRISELSLIRKLSNAITLDLGVEKSAGSFLDILMAELDITNASIMLFDESANCLRIRSVKNVYDHEARFVEFQGDASQIGRGASPKSGEGIAGKVFRDGAPIFVEDVEKDRRFCRYKDQSVIVGSLMCLPLIIRHRTIGVINLSHVQRNAFHIEECHGLIIAANQIAMMLDSVVNYQQLISTNRDLEAKVTERTRHLTQMNEELEVTRASLIKAERLKALGQMASGVAHDFNNLLTGILGKAQILMRRNADESTLDLLRSVELAALDGASIVKRIQDFSRIDAGTEFTTLDLNKVVEDTVQLTDTMVCQRKQMKSKALSVETELGPACLIEGDAPELREVLTNLIINAIDAIDDEGTINIATHMDESDVVLTVTDTGAGIEQDALDSVFDPFFTTKGPAHSGLGLSVIFGIVKNHGGVIEVQSSPGIGTQFIISLPRSHREISVEAPAEGGAALTSSTILVVDDEPAVREAIVMMLEELGHQVVSATNGTDGLVSFQNNDIDLVFTDLGMPDLDGWEVASRIKRIRPEVPIVMTTGWAREIDLEHARERGVSHVLGKPFALESLEEVLQMVSVTTH